MVVARTEGLEGEKEMRLDGVDTWAVGWAGLGSGRERPW